MNLKLSVALATYNGEKFIADQLRSIVDQSYQPYEIVICDDASTDSTWHYLKKFKEQSSVPIRLYQNPTNVGYVQNFARAIELCEGDYIALTDQDDYWLPNRLEEVASTIEETPTCGAVVTDAEVVDSQLNSLGFTLYSRRPLPNFEKSNVIDALIKQISIKGCTLIFRADLRPFVQPFPESGWGHDHWIVFTAAILSRICVVDKPLMRYRRHSASAGNDLPLDAQFTKIALQMYKDLSIDAYERDCRRWTTMFQHLSLLEENSAIINPESLADGIEKVRRRLDFAQTRLEMRRQKRIWRASSVLALLRTKQYHAFARGYRTMTKDLIA